MDSSLAGNNEYSSEQRRKEMQKLKFCIIQNNKMVDCKNRLQFFVLEAKPSRNEAF